MAKKTDVIVFEPRTNVVINKLIGEELTAKLAKIESQLEAQFKVKCSITGEETAVRRDVYMKRLMKVGGDIRCLTDNYVGKKARKQYGVDFLGRKKVNGSSASVLDINDLDID